MVIFIFLGKDTGDLLGNKSKILQEFQLAFSNLVLQVALVIEALRHYLTKGKLKKKPTQVTNVIVKAIVTPGSYSLS